MISVAICDDDSLQLAHSVTLFKAFLAAHPRFSARLFEFSSGDELYEYTLIHGGFDLYILDIVMPGTDGIRLAKDLRDRGDDGQIIYLTTEKSFALDAYDVHPYHYLIKPLLEETLFDVLLTVFSRLSDQKIKVLTVKTDSGFVNLIYDQIAFAELASRRIIYHLIDGTSVQSVMLRVTFAESVPPLLTDPRFVLCSASFLINLYHVKAIDRTSVSVNGDVTFSPPKKALPDLRSKWLNYWLEGDPHQ